MRHSIRNILQPTGSLYHFRFKSYGPLCDFHWFFWNHVTYKDDVVRQNRGCLVEAEFYKQRFPINQKFLRLPVQKLWPIMWFLQKWWPWPWSLSDFHQKNLPGSLELSTSAVKTSERLNQWCGLYIVQLRTDRQTNKQTDRQTDERALLECILCKIGLTDWVIYLVDWQWQRSRTQSIGPNDSNEKCAMSGVLFGINIAAIQKISDLDLLHLTLTVTVMFDLELDLLPHWALKKKIANKNKCLTSRDAKTVLRSLYRRQQSRSVFHQGTWCAKLEVSKTSGCKVMAQKVIFLVLDMFDLDLDISRSFYFWEFTICSRAWLV